MSEAGAAAAKELRRMAADLLATANRLDPAAAPARDPLTPGLRLTAAERLRQITEEGYTPEHDARHVGNELPWGAFCYLERAAQDNIPQGDPRVPRVWPWDRRLWKPKDSRIRNLVVASAMIVAEVDRRIILGETP